MALDWTQEEDLLPMDLYIRVGARNGGSIFKEIVQLSELLKRLNAYPSERQGEKYRNPDGVTSR